jgi:hypothetical protein
MGFRGAKDCAGGWTKNDSLGKFSLLAGKVQSRVIRSSHAIADGNIDE